MPRRSRHFNRKLEELKYAGGYFKGLEWNCKHTHKEHLNEEEKENLKIKLENVKFEVIFDNLVAI